MRFFIALEIPNEIRLQFQSIQANLSKIIPQAKLTDLDKLHLTIAFIGDQDDSLEDGLTETIRISAEGIHPFTLTPAYIDGFPSIHNPHTIWAGVKDDIDKVIIIRERIKDGLKKLNLDTDERRFVPHISLAKIPEDYEMSLETEERLQQIMQGFDPMHITSIKLFESEPQEGFHKHNTLAEIKLN